MKKLLSLAMLVLTLALTASAADFGAFNADGLRYAITSEENNNVVLLGFAGKAWKNLEIPATVAHNGKTYTVIDIAFTSFQNCKKLESVVIPSTVKFIHTYAFNGCKNLKSVEFPNSLLTIGWHSFENCKKLQSVDIPSSVTEIGEWAFSKCDNLTSVNIIGLETSMGIYAFSNCKKLTNVEMPVNYAGFMNAGIFEGCKSLTTFRIPDSVSRVFNALLYECRNLNTLTIGKSVRAINPLAFGKCTKLTTIYALPSTPPRVYESTFEGVPTDAVVYVPAGCAAAYAAADGWNRFSNFREMETMNTDRPEAVRGSVDITNYN